MYIGLGTVLARAFPANAAQWCAFVLPSMKPKKPTTRCPAETLAHASLSSALKPEARCRKPLPAHVVCDCAGLYMNGF